MNNDVVVNVAMVHSSPIKQKRETKEEKKFRLIREAKGKKVKTVSFGFGDLKPRVTHIQSYKKKNKQDYDYVCRN